MIRSLRLVCFNPHPHAEGDLCETPPCRMGFGFNPHPHAEGDFLSHWKSVLYQCFNPHPHAEGDFLAKFIVSIVNVSIHTLTRRVTLPITK